MSHDNHTTSTLHKEMQMGEGKLMSLVRGWVDPIKPPEVQEVDVYNPDRTINVVRDDVSGFGTKARAASAALMQPEYKNAKVLVYVAPRVGWAPMSLAKVCNDTGRKLILFAPAAATVSHHQLCAYSLGAELRFFRIAAMPVLQRRARAFAAKHGYTFFPLGLDVPSAVAAIAKTARALSDRHLGVGKHPAEAWSVISTGVLSRGLQVAWPRAKIMAVAVARNIKEGERGRADIISHHKAFLQNVTAQHAPPFPSVLSYDAKAWEYIKKGANDEAWFWNVAAEPPSDLILASPAKLNPNLDWGDESAFTKG